MLFRNLISLIFMALSASSDASQIKTAVFPAMNYNGELTGVFRLDTVLLIGDNPFFIGPYFGLHTQSPQVTDTMYGGALHIGSDHYFELQGGVLNRVFTQTGTQTLTGSGYMGNMVFGINMSPHLGFDIVFSAKRISEGTLDKRWIYNLLPMFTVRGDL